MDEGGVGRTRSLDDTLDILIQHGVLVFTCLPDVDQHCPAAPLDTTGVDPGVTMFMCEC